MNDHALRVLFLCTGNAARSQMAEALVRQLSKARIDAFSAGSMPQEMVHPMAASTLREKFGFPGDPERIHWSFEDLAAVEDEDGQRRAFEHVASGLSNRIRLWMALPGIRSRMDLVRAG